MSSPQSPRVLRAGLIVLDAETGQVIRVISLQYNPDSLDPRLPTQGRERGRRPGRSPAAHRPARADPHPRGRARRHRPAGRPGVEPDDGAARPRRAQLAAIEQLVYPSRRRRCSDAFVARRRRDARDRRRARAARAAGVRAPAAPARAHHRAVDHRGGLRPHAQPHPRQGPPRPPRAHRSTTWASTGAGSFASPRTSSSKSAPARANAGSLTDLGLEQL